MKFKKLISAALSAIMLTSAFPALADTGTEETEEDTAYLFAYFRDNPDTGKAIEELCYGVSRDGYNFRALNGGETVFTSYLGTEHLRDPFVFEGEDGYFYIVVTDMNSSTGWASQSTIAIYKTADLITMEDEILIDYKNFDGFEDCNRAWAPQIIWCPDHQNEDGTKGAYMIYLTIQNASTADTIGTVMYKHFATDLMDALTYTVPEFILTGEENGDYASEGAIDGDIIYDEINKRWLMYFDGRRIAVSDSVDGTYTELEETYTKAHSAERIEGSNMYKLLDKDNEGEDKWIFCADGSAYGTGFCVSVTSDFENYTDLAEGTDFTYDFTPRHGYVIPISESELTALFEEYGYLDLPNQFSDNPLDELTLPYTDYGYKIAGNITLPDSIDGYDETVTWESSSESVISTTETALSEEEQTKYGSAYTVIPAGVVTRCDTDTAVVLTATVTVDGTEYTKDYHVTVKAKPEKTYKEMSDDGDFTGYLYASFIEPAVSAAYQQTFFAISDDGLNWQDLNGNQAVLTSSMGTGGLRDHYLLRSPDGDRFYLLATDLDCTSGDWTAFSEDGSKYIMVWESDDLVNWSDQRMVKVADDNTGCAWAPEAIYDEITGEYIMYWSGTDINEDSDSYGNKVVYYSKTRDFYSFTDQQQFVYPIDTDGAEGTNTTRSFIDTTMIQGSDGLFYRVTKFEESSPLHVFVDAAEYPLGEYKRLSTNLDNTEFLGTEGPGWFKFNADDAESYGAKYCLMLDGYGSPNKGVGFFPSTIEDLNNDWDTIENETLEFTRVTENYKMRSYAKHGGIIPVTEEEYNALLEAYPIVEAEDLSEYINDELKVFDIADTYPDYPSEWTLPSTVSLDNDTYNYLGISGELVMGDGYGEDSDWVAVQFDMAANSTGDNIIRDIDGNAIIGYCYSSGSDGLWVGHGERSFGGTVYDSYGVKRLSNFLKTEVGGGSSSYATGRGLYSQHDICTIIMDNEYGTVDSYTGNYYTVETYINSILVSTEYYSGSFNGIGSIESTGKQYFGLLTIYASASSRSENTGSSEDYLLFAINFDGGSTEAQVGTAECTDIALDEGSDGTTAAVLNGTSSYISATQDDGTPLLRGTDTATISMRAKLEQPSTTNGWYFYTAWNNNAQSGGSRSYVGMYSDGTNGSLVAERYRDNSGTPTITADTGFDTWYDITYIIDGYLAEVYVDGEFVGSVDYESSGSDHIMSTILGSGDNIVTYFGRANWGSGEYAKGMFDDIAVYSFAPAIDLGDLTSVKSDIELPTAAESSDGYTIEWESSDETTVANDGTVTRPTDGDKIVTLTATITFGDKTLTREFEATVKEISNGVYIKSLEPDGSAISYELEAGDAFDSEKYDVYIAVYNEEGALNAVVKNQMSGTIETNSSANERIKVMVWEKDTMNPVVDAIETSVIETSVYKLMSYTTDGGEYYGSWSSATAPIIGNSLHLAVSSDGGETYTPLNYNTGVLYAEADYSAEGGNPYKGVGKMLRDPYVFRTATGYGVIAARADETSDTDSTDGSVMIYTSEDLTDFEFAGYLTLDTAAVYEPACVYENGKYTISWSTSDGGTRKYEVTEDFKSIGGEGASDEVYENPSIDIDHSVEATNVIGITAAEYKTLTANLNAPVNTGVEEFEDITVSAGANAVLPETATAIYNDGSTQEFPVTWDTSSLDTSVAGEYTLTGTVTAKDYDTSLIANRADPCVLYANGKYYFTATRDNGSQYVLNLRVADTIEGLADAEDILLYDAGSELIWAPEIHEVDGTMMIFFAYGATWDKVQSHVIVLEGDDAETADDWSEPQRIMLADGETNLIDNGITLDMTCFEWDGTYYLAWAQRQVSSSGDYNYSTYGYESSNIYIAKYNPANPAQLASDPVVISRPSYGWERTIAEVDEGPFVIENDGRLYMTVAANSTNCSYAIKLLTLNEGGDPTNPDDWSIKGYPLLSTAMNDSEPGPGHSSFTIDENGDPVLVYHWGSRGSNRTTTVKNVHFNTNGEPVLNIPRGEQLSDEFKTVTIKVTVE